VCDYVKGRIYVETSILVDYLDSEFNNKTDLKSFFRKEIPKARSLRDQYEFAVLETVVGEAIGQACIKGWDVVSSLEKLNSLVNVQFHAKISRMLCDSMACGIIFQIAEEIYKLERGDDRGMDLYDVWIVAQVLCDPSSVVFMDERWEGSE